MAYLLELLSRSFGDAWAVVVARSLPTAMIAIAVFLSSYFWLRRRQRYDEARDRWKRWAEAALIVERRSP